MDFQVSYDNHGFSSKTILLVVAPSTIFCYLYCPAVTSSMIPLAKLRVVMFLIPSNQFSESSENPWRLVMKLISFVDLSDEFDN